MRFWIVVKLVVEGYHRWLECPYEDVAFLRDKHRHMFHIQCRKVVVHSDRDVEIIRLKRQILQHYGEQPVDFGSLSCEMIAAELLDIFDLDYVEVLEDGENGAVVKS